MSYANPKSKQEFEFIAELMISAHKGSVPEEIVDRMRELYGEPIIKQVPADLVNRIRNASPELGKFYYSGGWHPWEGSGHVGKIGPEHYFKYVRRIVLEEFYPGKPGFDRVRQYWEKQRS